ncbi:hypothetical protein J3S20_23980 [Roseomonas tokyonensis]|nr:hypothetical protein [Falsiroseomonas tokyonensis]
MGRVVSVQVDAEGRLVLPEEVRAALGVQGGGEVLVQAHDGRLHIRPRDAAIRDAQAMVASMVPAGLSLQLMPRHRRPRPAELEHPGRPRRPAGRSRRPHPGPAAPRQRPSGAGGEAAQQRPAGPAGPGPRVDPRPHPG